MRRRPIGGTSRVPAAHSMDSCGVHWADRPHVMHALRASTRCAALAEAGILVPKLTAGQVGGGTQVLSASCAGQGTHLEVVSARRPWPGAVRRPLGTLRE